MENEWQRVKGRGKENALDGKGYVIGSSMPPNLPLPYLFLASHFHLILDAGRHEAESHLFSLLSLSPVRSLTHIH